MSKKKNFVVKDMTDNNVYLENCESGKRRIFTDNGKYLRSSEDPNSTIYELVDTVTDYPDLLKHGLPNRVKDYPTLHDMFGCVDRKGFLDILEKIYVNDLNFTKEQFWENTTKNPPALEKMYDKWLSTRDAKWLYNEKEYAFETLHCNLYVTIKSSKSGGTDRFATIRNTIMHLDLLDFDNREKFTILDLCSGMGLSTLMLAYRFRNSTVYYNELNPASRTVFTKLLDIANKHCGLSNVVILEKEEVDEELDVICAFEAVEHIPHQTTPKAGQPLPWTDKFLKMLKVGGYFLYETMWNAEFGLDGKVLGHFKEYEFDHEGTPKLYGVNPAKNGGRPEWGKFFQKSLHRRDIMRVNGKTAVGYNGLKWAFRGGPKVYVKQSDKVNVEF